ncbi:hypothetical protein Q0Z83_062380 [Actinoplanes sichuanensis]|uniref:Uncharacterized protein n=1 Tax=Actinoplanes sichuanensis TaxID=512349 RepID=A0ABW4A0B2_9ACTN|nr:hypothetical protein [Actinoplanes sichuanensis]BEL08047.1 hypothetical protein Q0Z83_062380 [Actinoplanes sichuanensis]
MHDEMLTLFDDCIERMLQLRAHLSASRRVHPGERHATVVSAIEVAAHFASEATRTVSLIDPPPAIPLALPRPAAVPPAALRPAAAAVPPAALRPAAAAVPPAALRPVVAPAAVVRPAALPAALSALPGEPAPSAKPMTTFPTLTATA